MTRSVADGRSPDALEPIASWRAPGAYLCLTFDNMGAAASIGEGAPDRPDPDEIGLSVGYPAIRRLLRDLELKATFFVEGWNADHHGDVLGDLSAEGHEIGLHGWVHERWQELADDEAIGLLQKGSDRLARLGLRPQAFRAPGGGSSVATRRELRRLGYAVDASLSAQAKVETSPEGVLQIPFGWPAVDGYTYLYRDVDAPDAADRLVRLWTGLLSTVAERGGVLTLIAHAHISGVQADRMAALRTVLSRAIDDARITICTVGDINLLHHAMTERV